MAISVEHPKTIIYGELYSGLRKKRRARRRIKQHPDQLSLLYWETGYGGEEVETMKAYNA
jgi:hypothetical protein